MVSGVARWRVVQCVVVEPGCGFGPHYWTWGTVCHCVPAPLAVVSIEEGVTCEGSIVAGAGRWVLGWFGR